MKLRFFLIGIALFFLLEIGAIVLFAISDTQKRQDTVAVNRVVQSVSAHFEELDASVLYTGLDYVVTDREENKACSRTILNVIFFRLKKHVQILRWRSH